MATRSGQIGGQFSLLTDSDISRIHESALRLLSDVGVQVEHPDLQRRFREVGAEVDPGPNIVRFPKELIDDALSVVPKRVDLYGRDADYDMALTDARVHLGTGGAAVQILDPDTDEVRRTTLDDLAQLARLVEQLEHVHFFHRPVVATDLPTEILDVNKYYTALRHTRKHIMGSAYTVQGAREVIELGSMVAGGEDALIQRPFISFVNSWMISPLKVDSGTAEVLVEIVKRGLPVALSSAPMAGSTAPATIAGIVTQVHAEQLSGIALTQLIREGAPVLYGPVPAAANMRNMAYAGGAIETGLMNAATVQMARSLQLPTYSDAGLTDSKLPDVQAGYEKMANVLLVALAGGNYIHHAAGMLEAMNTVAYEQYVIDNDIIGSTLRVLQGVDVNEETLATDVIEAVGPGGNFLTQPHTVRSARSDEYVQSQISDRQERDQWADVGGLDGRNRAKDRVRELLSGSADPLIPEELDRDVRERFDIRLPDDMD